MKKGQAQSKETPAQKRKRIADAKAAVAKRTVAQKEIICSSISDGVTLREICRAQDMPSWRTVYDWMGKDEEFAARIAHARESGYDAIAQECLAIADDRYNDYIESESGERLNSEHIQRSKLRIETRLKLLAKWSPKKYGEKLDVTSDNKAIVNTITILPVAAIDKTRQ